MSRLLVANEMLRERRPTLVGMGRLYGGDCYAPCVRREGTDPDHVTMSDVLCDFCGRAWTLDMPLLEGHHGSCICGDCLASAVRRMAIERVDDRVDGYRCTMCLEERADAAYRSPSRPVAFICRRCVDLGARTLERDRDFAWRRPEAIGHDDA